MQHEIFQIEFLQEKIIVGRRDVTNWTHLVKLFPIRNKTRFQILFLTNLTVFGLVPTYKDSGVVKVATPNLANSSPKRMKLGRDILLQAKILFNRPKVLMTYGHFQVTTTSSFWCVGTDKKMEGFWRFCWIYQKRLNWFSSNMSFFWKLSAVSSEIKSLKTGIPCCHGSRGSAGLKITPQEKEKKSGIFFLSILWWYYTLINQLWGPYGKIFGPQFWSTDRMKWGPYKKLRSEYFPYGTNNWLIRALLYSHQ